MESTERIIQNAEASLRMEGLCASADARRDCERVLNGDMTHEQYVQRVRERYSIDTEVTCG